MDLIQRLKRSRKINNAVQQQQGVNDSGYDFSTYTRHMDYNKLFFDGTNKAGKYDNFYGDSSKRANIDSQYPFFYVVNNEKVEPKEGTFAYFLENPNESYPQKKVFQQVYTELLTSGYSDLFLWRKDGKEETRHFDGKKYEEDTFRGFTLVSGCDKSRLTKKDRENIVRITLGASQANVFLGYSPSQAASAWVKMQDEMGLHMTAFARNAGMPIGKFIITAPSPEEYAKLRSGLDDKISGAKNNGKILYDYRPSESKVTQIEWVQFTSQDVQDYTPSLEFSEKKMTQTFGVPGTIKGTNDGENYATARVSEQVFIKYTVKPDVDDFREQLEFAIKRRFNLKGNIKSNIVIPEIADESLVMARAMVIQRDIFYKEIALGRTPESIVAAYNLPESFLLLEDVANVEDSANNTPNTKKHSHSTKDELFRQYKNALTTEEVKEVESGYRTATSEYADKILEDGMSEELTAAYQASMASHFEKEYKKIYNKTIDDVTDALLDELDSIDVSILDLDADELQEARQLYIERVSTFSKTFSEGIESLKGKAVTAMEEGKAARIERVVVTESEHTRIVSELKTWTKAQQEFPVRVYKTWKALPGACSECEDLNGTTLDVTSLFIANPTDEVYEVQGGGLHPNCRCLVLYEMDAEEVRK